MQSCCYSKSCQKLQKLSNSKTLKKLLLRELTVASHSIKPGKTVTVVISIIRKSPWLGSSRILFQGSFIATRMWLSRCISVSDVMNFEWTLNALCLLHGKFCFLVYSFFLKHKILLKFTMFCGCTALVAVRRTLFRFLCVLRTLCSLEVLCSNGVFITYLVQAVSAF